MSRIWTFPFELIKLGLNFIPRKIRKLSQNYDQQVMESPPLISTVSLMKSVSGNEEKTRLLFQESFEGSVLVELSSKGLLTLKWRRTSQESFSLLREIGNRCENSCENSLRGVGSKCSELRNEGFKMGEESLEKNRKKDRSTEVSAELHAVGSTGSASCLLGNVKTTSEDKAVESINALNTQTSKGSDTSYGNCHSETYEKLQSPSSSSNVLTLEAPFLNPELFQKSCSGGFTFLSRSGVRLLISTNYVIVAVLPLLAYVYESQTEEWKTLLFPCPVESCCITAGLCLAMYFPISDTHFSFHTTIHYPTRLLREFDVI